MSHMLDSLAKLLAFHEGCKLMPYKDSKGIWTIGIGHNLEANGMPPGIVPELKNGSILYPACMEYLHLHGITQEQCDKLFAYDLGHETAFLSSYPWFSHLDAARQAAVEDMAFNLGEHGFRKFTTFVSLMDVGRFADAGDDLLLNTEMKPGHELHARYSMLAQMLRSGDWPSVA